MNANTLSPEHLEQFRRLSTCAVASAIETFGIRLRNTGFSDAHVRCIFPEIPPVVGYAVTARIRASDPPMEGHSYYYRDDWWNDLCKVPAPRIVVVEDLDRPAGRGAFVGEVHANILKALGCTALVTNGAVRDLDAIRATGFQVFAGSVSVSHAYAHLFDFGGSIEVGGVKIEPGNLLHGDLHGFQTIPLEIASRVPEAALQILRNRERLIGICRSPSFSLDKLRKSIREVESWFENPIQKKTE